MDEGKVFAVSLLFVGACVLVILTGFLFHLGWRLLDAALI
jgi:hypothetical protein